MCRLLESIKVKKGRFFNQEYHQSRMNKSRQILFGINEPIDLSKLIFPANLNSHITYKCRIIYGKNIESITFLEYSPKTIRSLQLIHDNEIEYSFKYLNRDRLEHLKKKAPNSDDIIIVKNGLVTDATYANLVFFDGKEWITPSTPLMEGTKRAFYLDRGIIREAPIRESEVFDFKKVCLINALLDIEDGMCIDTQRIHKP